MSDIEGKKEIAVIASSPFDVEKTKYNEIITNQQTISIASENNGMLIWDIVYGKTVGHFIGVKLHDKVEQTQA